MHASRTVVARILKLLLSEHALTICFVNLVRTYSQSPPYDGFNPGFDTLVFTSFAIFWHRSTHISILFWTGSVRCINACMSSSPLLLLDTFLSSSLKKITGSMTLATGSTLPLGAFMTNDAPGLADMCPLGRLDDMVRFPRREAERWFPPNPRCDRCGGTSARHVSSKLVGKYSTIASLMDGYSRMVRTSSMASPTSLWFRERRKSALW